MVICNDCHERKATRKGLCNRCYQRIWMFNNKNNSSMIISRKEWIANNRERLMWLRAKNRARARNIPFFISLSDIAIPKICPVFNIPIQWGKKREFAPSLDRRDNSRGYFPDNIKVISQRANRLKKDVSLKELKALLLYLET